MTTTIQVHANHGWPVRVRKVNNAGLTTAPDEVVPAGTSRSYCVYDGVDLQIHEIQPHEMATKEPSRDPLAEVAQPTPKHTETTTKET